MAETLKQTKKFLRKEMTAKLGTVSEEDIRRQTEAVFKRVTEHEVYKNSRRISIYINTSGEIQTDDLIRHALNNGKQVFIPWFAKGQPIMQMIQLKDAAEFNELTPILWGIKQFPTIEGRKSYKEEGPLDLVLAPGVAFSRNGDRLGHGMAFYDKFFNEHNKIYGKFPYKMALALNEQILDKVPVDESDVNIDEVIFEAAEQEK